MKLARVYAYEKIGEWIAGLFRVFPMLIYAVLSDRLR